MKSDAIILYVDSTDPNWLNLYNKTFPNSTFDPNRYEPDGTLKYLFRAIEKNMPFVDKIHFVVQSKSQVPTWLDTSKVNVVLHEDFIPKEYLPTYNSQCIATFLSNIPNLSELYFSINDDCYPISLLSISDFYDNNLKPKIKLHKFGNSNSLFTKNVENSYKLACDKLNKPYGDLSYLLLPNHNILPLKKSNSQLYFSACKQEILQNNTAKLRNNNGYVYLGIYYNFLLGNLCDENPLGENFFNCKCQKDFDAIKEIISKGTKKTLCINEVSSEFKQPLVDLFATTYPSKSSFEL